MPREKGHKYIKKGDVHMGIMSCVNHRYNMQKNETEAATKRLITAVRGIPVQFRTHELTEALHETESIDFSSFESIKAHAQRLINAVEAAPAEYITNNAVDAAHHLNCCIKAM